MVALARSAQGWQRLERKRAELRADWASESLVRVSQPRPPVVTEWVGGVPMKHEEEASALGHTLTAEMLNLLGHPSKLRAVFPVRRALEDALPAWCRGHATQPYHRRPDGEFRPIHVEVARSLVYSDVPLEALALRLGLRLGAARVIAWGALRYADDVMRERAAQRRRPGRILAGATERAAQADDSGHPAAQAAGNARNQPAPA